MSSLRRISYKRLLFLSLFFVILFTSLSTLIINRGQKDRVWIQHRHKMDAELTGVNTAVMEMDLALHNYFLTGGREAKTTVTETEKAAFEHLAKARELTPRDTMQQRHLAELLSQLKSYKTQADSIIASEEGHINRTEMKIAILQAAVVRNHIKSSVKRLVAYEDKLLADRVKNVDTYDIGVLLIVIVFGIITIIIILYSFINLDIESKERKLAENKRQEMLNELMESEAKYRNLYNTSNDAIIITDGSGNIISWNKTATAIFGYTKKEVQGHSLATIIPPMLNGNKVLPETMVAGNKSKIIDTRFEFVGRNKSGKQFPVEVTLSRWEVKGSNYISSSIRDITIQKKAQENLNDAIAELKRSNENLGEFAYVASHDLQEPLRKIRAFGDLLLTRLEKDGHTSGTEYATRMIDAAERMQVLIQDLLSFSRVSREKGGKTPVDLNQVVKTTLDDMEITIAHENASIHYDNLPTLLANQTQMHQLFQNLLSNAIKFRKPHENPQITITCDIVKGENIPYNEIAAIKSRRYYRLIVKDNGIGFDMKYLEKIFTIFQRLHGRSEYKGTGIGLAVCKKIVENHHGFITARSNGNGAEFIILLPVEN